MGEPHIVAQPAEFLHVVDRAGTELFQTEGFFILRLGEVGVQENTVLIREFGRLTHQLRGDREG